MSIIKVEGISKRYQLGHIVSHKNLTNPFRRGLQRLMGSAVEEEVTEDFWALRDINFEVQQGEVVGIIGKNGAGKSTLLKILSRITDPSEGRIELNGRVASLLEVGTGFNPELTGRENIFLNGAILGMSRPEIQSKFDEIVAFAEVEKFLDTPVKRYSSGMYVRLAFAVAAHLEPEILIVDEVLAVGDIEFQKKCIGRMSDVAREGRTVLFVSHNIATVSALCSKGILLNKGKIVTKGPVEDCIEEYEKSFHVRTGSIVSHIAASNSNIEVTDVTVNGNRNDECNIADPNLPLDIVFSIRVVNKCRVSIEAFLHGAHSQNLGFFSPGHLTGDVYTLEEGEYEIVAKLHLPNLMKGLYMLTLRLADPSVKVHVELPFCIKLSVLGVATPTGIVFEQGPVAGYQVLAGSSCLYRKNSSKFQ